MRVTHIAVKSESYLPQFTYCGRVTGMQEGDYHVATSRTQRGGWYGWVPITCSACLLLYAEDPGLARVERFT